MDLISLFLFTHENNEIKSPTKIYDFTVYTQAWFAHGTNKKKSTIFGVNNFSFVINTIYI